MRERVSPFLTTAEAAQYLRVSRPTLERWRGEGRGPRYLRAGWRCLYRREDLDAFAGLAPEGDHETPRPAA